MPSRSNDGKPIINRTPARSGCCVHVPMRGLLTRDTLAELAAFLGAELSQEVFARQSAIVARNQNSRKAASGSDADRPLPDDVLAEETAVEAAVTAG